MPIASLDSLGEPARRVAQEYLDAIEAGLCAVDREVVHEVLDDVRTHLLDELTADASPRDVSELVGRLGAPDTFGAALCESLAAEELSDGAVRVLGVPYDIRLPTAERIASRWWNPRDPRLFVPRVFGVGWDLNFGAAAVKLHIIEPDAEDEPFGKTPDRAFARALAVPMLLALAMASTYGVLRERLPAQLPTHWSLSGTPDDFWAASTAFVFLFALAAVPTVWAAWSVATRRARLVRGAVIGLALLFSALAASIWALTLYTVLGGVPRWWLPPVAVLASLAVPLVMLSGLARAGRSAEQYDDLS